MAKAGPKVERIIKEYIKKLEEMNIIPLKVILFGSYAKGEAREDSDIDLIIVSKDFEKMNIRERLEILGIAAARIMQPIQADGYTPNELDAKEDAFLIEVLKHGKVTAL